MSSKKWILLMVTLSGIYIPCLSQLGVPGMEYVEYLRTEPRKSSVRQEGAESKISVPKYRSQDESMYRRPENTRTHISQRRQDVNVDENTHYRSQENTGTKNMYQNDTRSNYRRQEDTRTKNFRRIAGPRVRTSPRPRQDVNVDDFGSRELKKTEDENNLDKTKKKSSFSDYPYDTDITNSIIRISTESSPTVTEIYSETDKVIPQSDIIKMIPDTDNRNYGETEDTIKIAPCRGSECDLQATQASNKHSSVYQNYEDNASNQDYEDYASNQNYEDSASNQDIVIQSTEGTKQYVKMVRIPTTTSNPVEDTIIYQQQPISNPVQDTIIHEQKPAFTENSPNYSTYPVDQRSTYPVGHRSGPYYAPINEERYHSGEVYTDNRYVPNQFQRDVYPQNTYPTNVYRPNTYSNERYDNYDIVDYPAITYPTYDDRISQSPPNPSHYQAGPRPMAQLYYKPKPNLSSGFRPSEQFYPSNAAQQPVHSYQENLNSEPLPRQHNSNRNNNKRPVHNYQENLNAEPLPIQHNSNPYSDSSTLRYSKVRPQAQSLEYHNNNKRPVYNYQEKLKTEPLPIQHNSNRYSNSPNLRYSKVRQQSQALEDRNTNKRPTYRAPRYVRPSAVKNYDFNKVPKTIDLKKQVVATVTTPKPLDPAIEKMLRARAHKEAANRYYTGLQREIERSDLMADAVAAVRSRTHMKKFNTTKTSNKVKRSTTSYPAVLSITKTSIILPETQYQKKVLSETQYQKKEVETSGNRRKSRVLSNSRSKKDINSPSFHHNLPIHPLYKNLPGRENYEASKITTKSPDIRQKALELKKFQKVKSQFDALVPKASYTPEPYPTYPSYPGQKLHMPRPTTFRPYTIPKYNKFYKPGQYIRPAKVQVSRIYEQREYIPKYVRPEGYKKDAQYVLSQAPPSAFVDIPKESVRLNTPSSYLKTSEVERPIVYHKPQVRPKYVIVRTPTQLKVSPEYLANPKVQSNLNNAQREYRQAAETPDNTKHHVPAIQKPQREYREIVNDDESHHIRETYSNPRQHRGLIIHSPEIQKIHQSYAPKPYANPRQHKALIQPVTERPKLHQSYSPKPYTTEQYSNPRQHRPLNKPVTERPKLQQSYSPKPYTTEPYSNPRQHIPLNKPVTERPKLQPSYSPNPPTTEFIESPRDKRRSMEISIDKNVKFPQFGYNIDRYFEDFPQFGFFHDE